MGFEKEIKHLFERGHEIYVRNISVDCVIFGFNNNSLKVLLLKIKYAEEFALPGGFILKDEHLDSAAKRVLKERTGLQDIFLQQFYVFSEPNRSTKKINKKFLNNTGISMNESWMFERFITVGFTALVDFTKVQPVADNFSESCEWYDVHNIPTLILDHNNILQKALYNLRIQLNYQPVGYNLLPKKFTMPDLQKLYETILDINLDRRNFQRKIIATGILKRLEETKKDVAHKAPYLYKFDLSVYHKTLNAGIGFNN